MGALRLNDAGRLVLVLLLFVAGPAPVRATEVAEPLDGPSILASFIIRHQVPYEMERMTVRLVDREGRREERELRRYSRRWEDGGSRHLLVVDAPENLAGTALLSWQRPGQADQLWSFLPATGEVRAQSARPGAGRRYFMGTDLTYEDLAFEDVHRYTYERMPDDRVDEADVFVVRAFPATNSVARSSAYLHRDLFLRKQDFALLQVQYHDQRGRLTKRLRALSAPVEIGGGASRVDHLVMENVKAAHRTELIVRQREVSAAAVPRKVFEVGHLEQRRHLQ